MFSHGHQNSAFFLPSKQVSSPEQDPENVGHDEGQTDVEREPLGGPAALDGQVLGHVGHDSAEDHGELAAEGNLKLSKEE